ncbi:MAG: hypothetical protein VXY94_05045 [Planctomycetota bacterium]|nr:hypothetical protein [Planctomycetota bacterium]MEC8733573.1 hypothetical protein [Planctomycetota bacterium]MEC8818088.1 hypothetical protein [Planctomycetota bacterium]MEC9157359.1 hypothetical protein [Planctomycetota bacterium]MEC9232332.1 hypothetical protein [Planctomycetota bacterium]
MLWNIPGELNVRERRFVRAALWRVGPDPINGTTVMMVAWLLAGASALVALGSSTPGVDVVFWMLSLGLLVTGTLLLVRERRTRLPDALMAINRCGRCGHSLNGTERMAGRGVDLRTCSECGKSWTNLDRRSSIEEVYR